jgi:hypothetical protein
MSLAGDHEPDLALGTALLVPGDQLLEEPLLPAPAAGSPVVSAMAAMGKGLL